MNWFTVLMKGQGYHCQIRGYTSHHPCLSDGEKEGGERDGERGILLERQGKMSVKDFDEILDKCHIYKSLEVSSVYACSVISLVT